MLKKNITTVLFFGMQMLAGLSAAQEIKPAEEDRVFDLSLEDLMKIQVVTGTRFDNRKLSDSPAAITSFTSKDILTDQASHDMNDVLRDLLPSFNVLSQPINDGSAFVQPFSLRGLSSDETLVLINGKRFHRAAVLTTSLARSGSQGPEISNLPAMGIKRVEVLSDGASAQYGSDAIAGVINFILKDNSEGGEIIVQRGGTKAGDGDSNRAMMNFGTRLKDKGFLSITADIVDRSRTSRGFQRADAAYYASQGLSVPNPAQIWGTPEFDSNRFLWNGRMDAGNNNSLYMFGNFSDTHNNTDFYYRNLARGLFNSNLDSSGVHSCNAVPNDQFGLLSAQQCLADANANNQFNFQSFFPGGFTPRFSGEDMDFSQVVGLKGDIGSKGSYDISAAYGRNSMAYHLDNTVNPSLGSASPTHFDLGQLVQTERNVNADFTLPYSKQLSLAAGLEWRQETYEIKAGDQASWQTGPFSTLGIGSNGFPGFDPATAGLFKRENIGAYVDSEYNFTDAFLVALAGRHENFSDFGGTTNGKISSRYRLNEQTTLRGSFGTGFRAPSPGQANTTSISHNASGPGNSVVTVGIIPPTSALAQYFGGKALQPEKSTNLSFGMSYQHNAFGGSLDVFQIDVRDRVTLSQKFDATLAVGVPNPSNFGNEIYFFTNYFDSRTRGAELMAKYDLRGGAGDTEFKLTWSHVTTEVTRVTQGSIADPQYDQILPKDRANLRVTHARGNWTFTGNGNYFGPWSYFNPENSTRDFLGSQFVLDLEAGYNFKKNWTFSVSVGNVFNSYPTQSQSHVLTFAGNPYNSISPDGILGTTYYARLNYRF